MVTQTVAARKPLVSPELLEVAAAHGRGIDTRGLRYLPAAEASAIVRAQASGIRPLHASHNRWIVASASRPGLAHELNVWGSNGSTKVTCSCEGYRGHHHCWHSDLVAHELHVASLGLPSCLEASTHATSRPVETVTRLEDLYAEPGGRAREAW